MNYTYFAVAMSGFFVSAFIAVFVLARNIHEKLNRLFFAYSIGVAFFCFFNSLSFVAKSPAMAKTFTDIAVLCWSLFLAVFLHFCLVLSGRISKRAGRIGLLAAYVSGFVISLVNMRYSTFYAVPRMTPWGFSPPMAEYNWILQLYSVVIVSAAIRLLYLSWKGSVTRRDKQRSAAIFFALIGAFIIGALTDIVFPVIGIYQTSLIPVAATTYAFLFGIVIIRYGFLIVTPAVLAQNMLDTMQDPLVFVGPAGNISMVNDRYLDITGYSKDEIMGNDFAELHGHDDPAEHERTQSKIGKEQYVKAVKVWLIKKGEGRIPVMETASVVIDNANNEIGRLYIFRDMTEETRLLEQQKLAIAELTRTKSRMLSILEDTNDKARDLAKAVEELKVVDKMKTEFLSTISHELRTPLTPIRGYSSMLLSGSAGPLTPGQKKAVAAIERQGEHLLDLIDSVLDVTRMTHGKGMALNKVPLSMKDLLNGVCEALLLQFDSREIKFSRVVPDDLPVIMADKAKLARLMSNLLGNAAKFTPKRGEAVLSASSGPETVRIEIKDNGIGIASDEIAKVFEAFHQADSSYAREAGGVGLGLAVAKEIAEAHGGKIWAESKGIGSGSIFIVELPIVGGQNG